MSNDWIAKTARYVYIKQMADAGHKTFSLCPKAIEAISAIISRHAPPVEELLEAARKVVRRAGIVSKWRGPIDCREVEPEMDIDALRSALSHWEEKK